VHAVEPLSGDLVRRTLEELAADLPIAAVRIGMLGSAEVAVVVADFLEKLRPPIVVLDPILQASSGAELLEPEGVEIVRTRFLRLATVVTPNILEAEVLTGIAVRDDSGQRAAGAKLLESGCQAAVVTGGHLKEASDLLLWRRTERGTGEQWFRGPKIESRSTHGTGCAFATSLACGLALGKPLPEAVGAAKEFVRRAIQTAEPMGRGTGPMKLI
jgi:hydroxymethylpyrimidine/phosphomethylpyrimidine kinase